MAQRFNHAADIGGQTVPYSAVPRAERNRWMVLFDDQDGNRKRILTAHEIRGKHPPDQFHLDATKIIKDIYRPATLFPDTTRKSWDELLTEVQEKYPHTRAETLRSFRAGVKAFKEILPAVLSPADVSDDLATRFRVLWLAAPGKNGKKRSPVTLSYYLRALSAFSNHLKELGYITRNVFKGLPVPKAEKTRKAVPTDDQFNHFWDWLHARYPAWTSLHALIETKAISASRTADVCQLKTAQLKNNALTFGADTVKTKVARSLPLPADLFQTLTQTAGAVYIWEGFFKDIPKYRKQSNGLPPAFEWQTVRNVINNIFREYNDSHPDQPRLAPHGIRRRGVTATVKATGSVDAAASALGLHPQTARAHYLDAQQAFETEETMRKVADALRPKRTPNVHQTDPDKPKTPEN